MNIIYDFHFKMESNNLWRWGFNLLIQTFSPRSSWNHFRLFNVKTNPTSFSFVCLADRILKAVKSSNLSWNVINHKSILGPQFMFWESDFWKSQKPFFQVHKVVLFAGICSFSDILLLCLILCYFHFVVVLKKDIWLQSSSSLLYKKAKFSSASSLNLQEGKKKKRRVNKLLLWQ